MKKPMKKIWMTILPLLALSVLLLAKGGEGGSACNERAQVRDYLDGAERSHRKNPACRKIYRSSSLPQYIL